MVCRIFVSESWKNCWMISCTVLVKWGDVHPYICVSLAVSELEGRLLLTRTMSLRNCDIERDWYACAQGQEDFLLCRLKAHIFHSENCNSVVFLVRRQYVHKKLELKMSSSLRR